MSRCLAAGDVVLGAFCTTIGLSRLCKIVSLWSNTCGASPITIYNRHDRLCVVLGVIILTGGLKFLGVLTTLEMQFHLWLWRYADLADATVLVRIVFVVGKRNNWRWWTWLNEPSAYVKTPRCIGLWFCISKKIDYFFRYDNEELIC